MDPFTESALTESLSLGVIKPAQPAPHLDLPLSVAEMEAEMENATTTEEFDALMEAHRFGMCQAKEMTAPFHYVPRRGLQGSDVESIIMYEFVNEAVAQKLLYNWDTLWAEGKLGCGVWKFGHDQEEEPDLSSIARDAAKVTFRAWLEDVETKARKGVRSGTRRVMYRQTKAGGQYGRYYAHRSHGMSAFARAIRHTLALEFYIDIDARNCHPTIMLWLADKHGLTSQEALREYTLSKESREAMLERIRLLLGPDATREDAKKHTLSWAYGRNLHGWLKSKVAERRQEAKALLGDAAVKALHESMRLTNDGIAKTYPEKRAIVEASNRAKKLPADKNLAAKIASRVIQDVENDMLLDAVDFLTTKPNQKLRAENRVPGHDVLMFDGFQLPIERLHTFEAAGFSIDDMLRKTEAYIAKKNHGLDIHLEVKPMDCAMDLSAYPDPPAPLCPEEVAAEAKRQRLEDASGAVHTVGSIEFRDETGAWYERLMRLLVKNPEDTSVEHKSSMEVATELFAELISADFVLGLVEDQWIPYQWNGQYWRKLPDGKNNTFCDLQGIWKKFKEFADHAAVEFVRNFNVGLDDKAPRAKFQTEVWKVISRTTSFGAAGGVFKTLLGMPDSPLRRVHADEWENPSHIVQFENCRYDATAGTITAQPDRALLINRSNGVTLTERVESDLERVRAYVRDTLAGEAEHQFFTGFLGSCLWRGNEQQFALFMTGTGSNGKTMMLSTLSGVFGNEYHTVGAASLTEQAKTGANPDIYECRFDRMTVFNELSATDKLKADRFKSLADGSAQRVRTLYQTAMTTVTLSKLCFAVNELPQFDTYDGGVDRRFFVLPVTNQYKESFDFDATNPHHRLKDTTLEKWLRTPDAISAFWYFLMDECRDQYMACGRKLQMTETMKAVTAEAKEEQNPIGSWLKRRIVRKPGNKILLETITNFIRQDTDQPKLLGRQVSSKLQTEMGLVKGLSLSDPRDIFKLDASGIYLIGWGLRERDTSTEQSEA